MQATSTSRCSASNTGCKFGCSRTWLSQQQQGRHVLHVVGRRCRTIARYQQQAPQSETSVQVPENSRQKSAVPIPAPQEMQASVMLVPKATAAQSLLKKAEEGGSPLDGFLVKCRLAWNLFFPPGETSAPQLSPKELGKQRLSMILVADRCGLSPNSLVEMKKSTLAALQDCMDLEDLQDAHLRFTMTRENGVTYSMAVPILRPEANTEEQDADDAADFDAEFDTEYETEFDAEFDTDLEVELQTGQEAGVSDLATAEAAEAETWGEHGAYAVVTGGSDSYAVVEDQQPLPAATVAEAADAVTIEPAAAVQAAVLPRPKGWAVRPGGTSRAGSRAGRVSSSRGSSPAAEGRAVIPLEGSAVMTPDMLKELLVEELVQDVEEMVEHMGPQAAVRAMDAGDGTLIIEPTAAADGSEASAAAAVAADVLTEQLEAAVAEVQHFGEGTGDAGRKGSDGKSSSSKWGKLMM